MKKIKPVKKIRVVGFYADAENFNKGKKQELEDRKYYKQK